MYIYIYIYGGVSFITYQGKWYRGPPVTYLQKGVSNNYQPTHLPTYQHTNILTYQPTNLSTYQPTNIPTYLPTNLPTYPPTQIHI